MAELRDHQRQPIALRGHLRAPRGRQDVAVSDLSTTGCKIDAVYLSMSSGEHVTIRPEGLQVLPAKVVWCSGPSAGLLFENPLHPAVLDNLCRLHPAAKDAMA